MEWSDRGYILATRKHGENALIVSALTETRGRQAGLVRGGAGRRKRGGLQVGNLVALNWRGRLPEHLGTLTTEVLEAPASSLLDRPDGLAALAAACAVAEALLPEGEEHPAIFHGLAGLMTVLDDPDVGSAYVKWEVGVLGELGFGLDLSACAATGETENLAYVSPKTGRAVSAEAGRPYHGRLLALPAFLLGAGAAKTPAEVVDGLRLTGYFLESHALDGRAGRLAARDRLVERFQAKK
ncbi:MAG: DNA repair protein RecO [Rhodospirillales bacterium CG15_BIG_FIL_POST_REV_8_21_14_020_66_15]|nr:MAG: DNA repair protein RecO [Rhodospirillales bacterium CG15_BIG_FIL_POST_REV_8_21_14_020_66_15]